MILGIAALGFLALPGRAGLVDFSEGLLAYVTKRWGAETKPRLMTWQRLVRDTRPGTEPKSEGAALRRINGFFNQVPYFNDIKHWGVDDYWATPVETLSSFGADCEDYAIAKFLSLKELGVPVDRLRITYVRAINIGESHMVLAYYPTPDADPLIMDNLIPEVKPASQRPDLEPVYSFNDDDLWLASGQAKKGGSSQVRLWRDLKDKLAREQKM
jgi:predicted transglutaminase-like cysteine proteinase